MSVKKVLFLIIVIVMLSVAVETLFGGWISARLATWPPIRRFNLYNPQAPIVVTNREVIRTSDTQDAVDAVNRAKSRLSAVVMFRQGQLTVTGTAVNVTSDGYFVTAQTAFATRGATYFVVLNNGQSLPISGLYADPGTGLMIFRADGHDVPVAPFADSKGLLPGQKIIFASSGLSAFTLGFRESYVVMRQNYIDARVFDADQPSRTFGAQNVGALLPGEALVTLDGEVAGLWNGSSIVSSNVLNNTLNLFFSNNNVVRRPVYGFTYRMITRAESATLNVPQGALVAPADASTPAITPASPASAAGLQAGDYIVRVNETTINEDTHLEEVLERFKPGDQVSFTVVRDKQTLILNLIVGGPRL